MPRSAERPAALSQMPGAKMRGRLSSSTGFAVGSGGEDGVEVGGDEDAGSRDCWSRLRMERGGSRCLGQFGEGVACFVDVDVGEAEGLEAVEEPGGAGGFAEGWGGDADELELPLAELRLVEMQPVEGAVDGGEAWRGG